MNENSEKGTSFFLHKKDKDPTSVRSHYLKSADNLAAKCKKWFYKRPSYALIN